MKTFHQHQGVTLFEVLISMAVFAVITAIVLFGFVDSKKVQDLRAASGQLVADLRQIQTLAFSNQPFAVCSTPAPATSFGKQCTGTTDSVVCGSGTNNCGLVPAGGYGLSITECTTPPCSYDIYGDISDGTLARSPDGQRSPGTGPNSVPDPVLRLVTLPPKISVFSIKVTDATSTVISVPLSNMFSVNVIPPKPTTSFTYNDSGALITTGVRVSFCLEHEQSHLRRLVTMVAASGQVIDKVVPNCP